MAEHVLGYDELEPLLDAVHAGVGRGRRPACRRALIEHVARAYGRGPSLLWMGQGLQRQPRGGNVMRAIAMLPALTGNIRRPGSGFLYLNGGDSRGIDYDWLTGADLARRGRARVDQPDGSRRRPRPTRRAAARSSAGTSTPSPRAPSRRRCARRSSARICSPSCAISSSPTPPTYADYVLPAASASSRATTSSPSYFHHTLSAQVKAVDAARPRAAATPRSSAASPPTWASTSPSCRRATAR